METALREAAKGPVAAGDAHHLAAQGLELLPQLKQVAAQRRDQHWQRTLTFSPKVFLPITNLCRNRCDYCSFRRSPGDTGEWTMTPAEVESWLRQGQALGCSEALLCLGDTPETGFRDYRAMLAIWGHQRTVDYLCWASARALERELLPHTNAGILSGDDMAALRKTNVSLGLMLENVSERLCAPGMPHHKAPDKRPRKRLEMLEQAGAMRIPFTTGLLIGIGETVAERVDTLLAIRALHERHGHIQEVIVQNLRVHPDTPLGARDSGGPGAPAAGAGEPDAADVEHAVALARIVLPDEISVQAPPNLNQASVEGLVAAGVNDFGGISPVTPDYINPLHPWPHLDGLRRRCADLGFRLEPRLPIYGGYLTRPGWIDEDLRKPAMKLQSQLGRFWSHQTALSGTTKHAEPILEARSS